MTESSSYPASDESDQPRPEPTTSWGVRLVIGLGVALLVVIVVLHLTGVVGPAAH